MGLIPDLMDHLEDKRISVSGTIQPRFVPSLTARRALVALGFGGTAQRRWSSIFTGLALGTAAHPHAGTESARSPDCCPIASLAPCWEPSHLFPAGSWRLLALKMPGCLSFPGCRDPPRYHRRCLPSSRPAGVGFGPPRSRMRTLLFALKARPERVTRWQQQTQEGPQMGFLAAGWFS